MQNKSIKVTLLSFVKIKNLQGEFSMSILFACTMYSLCLFHFILYKILRKYAPNSEITAVILENTKETREERDTWKALAKLLMFYIFNILLFIYLFTLKMQV